MKQILLTLALVLSVLTVGAATQQPKPQQWEYKIEWNINEKKANELGSQGWELVAVDTQSNVQEYAFKRAK